MRSIRSPLDGFRSPFGRKSGGITVSIGSGLVITGTELTATVNGLAGGETVTYQWTDDGANITGATASTYSPTIGTDSVADASAIRCVTTVDGTPFTSNARTLRKVLATAAGALGPYTFTEDEAIAPVDLSADFTLNGNTLTFAMVSALPAGLEVASNGLLSGTPTTVTGAASYTVRATDEYGETVDSTFSVTVEEAPLYTVSIGSGDVVSGTELTRVINGLVGGETIVNVWTDDGVAISGATADSYTVTIGTDGVADGSLIRWAGTINGDTYTSPARTLIEDAGSAPVLTLIADDLELDPPVFSFSNTAAGTLTWDFNTTNVDPGKGLGDIATGSEAVASGEVFYEIDLTAYPGETGYVFFRVTNGVGDSNVLTSQVITVPSADVTAPVLSSPTAAANGTTGATSLGVTTDEGNGTLYWGIYPTASTPSAADVVAGTGATVSGSQAVSTTGAQSVANQSGLTASTAYKAHYVHDDAAANRSNLATSAEFTTGAITNLITNGTFDTDTTGWTAGDSGILTVVSGELEIENGAAARGIAYQSFTTTIGVTYNVTLTASGGTINQDVRVGNSAGNGALLSLADVSGSVSNSFVASATTTFITLRNGQTTLGGVTLWDNVVVSAA